MPSFDSTAITHLDSGHPSKPIFFIYLDVDGDPIRGTTVGHAVLMPTLSDPDLSGQTFYPTSSILTVGDVDQKEGGSDTLVVEVSGLLLPDADLLAAIGDRLKWQSRHARLWVMLRDESRAQQGAIAEYYNGYMSSVRILPRPDSQVIRIEIEGYKALLTGASNRSYLDQASFDSADISATATIGAANGTAAGGASGAGAAGAGNGSGRFDPMNVASF